MRKKIKIYFTDFWKLFKIDDNYFLDLLKDRYNIVLDSENPDFLFYSNFGYNFRSYDCLRIYFTGENVRPDFKKCDYAFSFDYIENNPHNYRLPLYALFNDVNLLTVPFDAEQELRSKTGFCNFIYSNPVPQERIDFFKKLSKYKKVDSSGRFLNNMGYVVKDKQEFLSNYKFSIAFENESYPGYTTEKIFEPMLAHSVPIYWGNPLVGRDFNTKSFLNYHEFSSDDELIDKIIQLDNNDDLYLEYLSQPYFADNKINNYVNKENILHQFELIFNSQIHPVSNNSKIFSQNIILRKTFFSLINLKYYLSLYTKKIINFRFSKISIKLKKIIEIN